jgi:hypothetical protein
VNNRTTTDKLISCMWILIEKNEMGGACGTYGGEERRIQGFGGET